MTHPEHEDMKCDGDDEIDPVLVTTLIIGIQLCLFYIVWRIFG